MSIFLYFCELRVYLFLGYCSCSTCDVTRPSATFFDPPPLERTLVFIVCFQKSGAGCLVLSLFGFLVAWSGGFLYTFGRVVELLWITLRLLDGDPASAKIALCLCVLPSDSSYLFLFSPFAASTFGLAVSSAHVSLRCALRCACIAFVFW